jgi:hypothetical protein
MPKQITTIQKCAWGFAALFLGVYLLDYVPGIMDSNGLMFGLFHMTRIVDLGHLAAGALGVIGALTSARGARVYFYVLGTWYLIDVVVYFVTRVNLPHILIFIAAFWIAATVSRNLSEA